MMISPLAVNLLVIQSFKNKEKKWEEGKNCMSERVARLERKIENEERRRRNNNIVISTALLLDSNIRNSVCTPAKLPCRREEVG
jgi:hypothetical protein